MSEEQFKALMESHRSIHQSLNVIKVMISLIFVMVVLAPVLQQFGLWNLLGIGQ